MIHIPSRKPFAILPFWMAKGSPDQPLSFSGGNFRPIIFQGPTRMLPHQAKITNLATSKGWIHNKQRHRKQPTAVPVCCCESLKVTQNLLEDKWKPKKLPKFEEKLIPYLGAFSRPSFPSMQSMTVTKPIFWPVFLVACDWEPTCGIWLLPPKKTPNCSVPPEAPSGHCSEAKDEANSNCS